MKISYKIQRNLSKMISIFDEQRKFIDNIIEERREQENGNN